MKSVFLSTLAGIAFSVAAFAQAGPVAVINYSGFNPQAPIAPGSIASAYGNFGNVAVTTAPSLNPMPTSLAGISIRINNVPAPLYFVSTAQINFVVPVATANGRQTVEVLNGTQVIASGTVNVWEAFPALASSDTTPTRQGIILNQDSSINSQAQRSRRGEVIQLFATGCGAVNPVVADGVPPTGLSRTVLPVTATIAGLEAVVQFAGASPQFPGICQVNITLPTQAFVTGQSQVQISVGGIVSNPVSVWVE
jgi:uncharacterized protein (TIGR03437 family)